VPKFLSAYFVSGFIFENQKEEPLFSALPSIDYHIYFPAIKMKEGEKARNPSGFFSSASVPCATPKKMLFHISPSLYEWI